ncbi:hypothetical protein PHLGIDRAFT_359528 [Phlebiopsis gigantea 11061_1 CR5-6]|uniref:NAD(P)-binding protein n=1 Tax=Phlebiopsis gigantea (strain 11061_1 CR5-6) TaxID=745531 RepID=A0A0C3NA92_PHLG1|nr:hypothetical protein PHLGIDRAFT_359528 [Phlebiopsis gigantea 11061_1 CR5-6]
MPQVWLITGSSSGIGRKMTELALEQGDHVVATLRTPSALADVQAKHPASQLHVVALDITDSAQIAAAFAAAKRVFGRLDVVFNNAGWCIIGEVESVAENDARRLFDVNFWGTVNVSKEAVRFFREENAPGSGGRLLIVTSSGAMLPCPAIGYYCATKSGVEAVMQVVAAEIEPEWNIKMTLIEPGFTRTDIADKSFITVTHPAYVKPTNAASEARKYIVGQFNPATAQNVSNLDRMVARMFDVSRLEKPPLWLPLGEDALERVRTQMEMVGNDLRAYKSWSEGLLET